MSRLTGFTYTDYVHFFALFRAGYIPQPFSLHPRFPHLVSGMMKKSNALTILLDPSVSDIIPGHLIPTLEAISATELPLIDEETVKGAFYMTSGSTSDLPKLVHHNLKAFQTLVYKTSTATNHGIINALGSICYVGQLGVLMANMHHCCPIILPTGIPFQKDELLAMFHQLSMRRLILFPTHITTFFRQSKIDPELLEVLKQFHQVAYTGAPLPSSDISYALENGIKLQSVAGQTELFGTLRSPIGDPESSRPVPGVKYHFTEQGELVVLKDSIDIPSQREFLAEDGCFYTGDIFEKKGDGWRFVGRNDDRIKAEYGGYYWPRYIEDEVIRVCSDVVTSCIVLGAGRISPTLVVEVEDINSEEAKSIPKLVVQRLKGWMEKRYSHESIVEEKFVVVVKKGELPRTANKGNVRRAAAEKQFKELLDGIYA
ncbi:Similar to Malonate--CoA ligase; acc. no. Q8H151 [Pyronema omphalodes CBS 100304]|uniref:Similar to Malonate--CoA ligase acc. no. Q8H151 n=1 Tax=Pyronema omphalodes (strain CBS 100304) TaxID=1076935 RepID=U4KYU8_PYROM|nr:Similar to Malonate--CoA ligase; acc. no. Q8H151 [Pyronema omphalodes CBS 100304]